VRPVVVTLDFFKGSPWKTASAANACAWPACKISNYSIMFSFLPCSLPQHLLTPETFETTAIYEMPS